MVSEIRDTEGIALPFLRHDSQLPTSVPAAPVPAGKGVTGGERSWGERTGLVLRGGMPGGCYRSEKQAQK